MTPLTTAATDRSAAAGRTSLLLQALLAACFGVLLLTGAGFVQIEAVHNAAHDARHANGFPCH